jgi:diguanylate cyclase (GGDEF)-like protein
MLTSNIATMSEFRQLVEPELNPIDRVTSLVRQALGYPYVAFAAIDIERHYFGSKLGLADHEAPFCAPLCAAAMFSEQPVALADLSADPRFAGLPVVVREPSLRSFVGVAVRNPQRFPVGALWAADTRVREVSATQLSVMVDCAQLIERELLLRALARYDALTGLHNSSYCDVEIEREWRRARRSRQALSLLVIDVDEMSGFNETYGHPAGDRALRAISELLMRTFRRASDLLMRIAGDRIIALLPETSGDDALRLAEMVRTEIMALGLGNPATGSVLTVSIGCTTAAEPHVFNAGFKGLIEEASLALERAKVAGRNRVMRAAAHPGESADVLVSHR